MNSTNVERDPIIFRIFRSDSYREPGDTDLPKLLSIPQSVAAAGGTKSHTSVYRG